jgi:hypothetical protein
MWGFIYLWPGLLISSAYNCDGKKYISVLCGGLHKRNIMTGNSIIDTIIITKGRVIIRLVGSEYLGTVVW